MKHVHRILSFFKGLSDLIFDQISGCGHGIDSQEVVFPHETTWS
jgi:hypothetical protein